MIDELFVCYLEIKAHPFFECLDWDNLDQHPAHFIPNPAHAYDTTYFDGMYM